MNFRIRSFCALLTLFGLLAIPCQWIALVDAAVCQQSVTPAAQEAETETQESNPDQPPKSVEPPLTETDLSEEQLDDDLLAITDLATLQEKWNQVDKQLTDTEVKFQITTDAAQQETIRQDFVDLVDRANAIIARINTVALEEIRNNPKNKVAARLLLGIMMNDAEFNRSSNVINLGDQLIQAGIEPVYFETAAKADRLSIFSKEIFEELQTRLREATADDLPRVKIATSKGDIVVELFENEAPNTVANFISLVDKNYYDGLKFHRVIEGFMAQGGDPEGDGSGGPGYTIKCECVAPDARRHFNGSLSMANAGKDTGGSQFFLTFKRTTALDGKHTVFGRIIEGMDVLDTITRTYDSASNQPLPGTQPDVINSMEVIRKRNHDYVPVKIGDPEKQPEPPPAQPPIQPPADPDQAKSGDGASDPSQSSDTTSDKGAAAKPGDGQPDDGNSGNAKSDDGQAGGESSESSGGNSDDPKEKDDQ